MWIQVPLLISLQIIPFVESSEPKENTKGMWKIVDKEQKNLAKSMYRLLSLISLKKRPIRTDPFCPI